MVICVLLISLMFIHFPVFTFVVCSIISCRKSKIVVGSCLIFHLFYNVLIFRGRVHL